MRHWASERYWADALDRYMAFRDGGGQTIEVDIRAVEHAIFDGSGPACRLLEAMGSVLEQEGQDGFRGAPRLVLALLMHLRELTEAAQTQPPR